MPTVALALLAGMWLVAQGTAGRLAARLLSGREMRPGELPTETAPGITGPAGATPVAGAAVGLAGSVSGWIWPVHGPVTQEFGHNGHPGIDIGIPDNTPVAAARDATVAPTIPDPTGYGNFVRLDHGNGDTTLYGHLTTVVVAVGQHVAQGTTIGLSGHTGYATGPHLHFETARNGGRVDPRSVIGGTP